MSPWIVAAMAIALAVDQGPPVPPGTVAGTVRWTGRAPLRIKTLTNTIDVESCGAEVRSDVIVVAGRGAIANVFVELRGPEGELLDAAPWAGPPARPVMSLQGCRAEPHVVVVPSGATVEIENPDHLPHELVTRATDNPIWQHDLPRYRRRVLIPERHLQRPEGVVLACGRHPVMSAWIRVTDNPRHVLSAPDGSFRLDDVPPGTWRLVATHEELGRVETTVEIASGETTAVELEYR